MRKRYYFLGFIFDNHVIIKTLRDDQYISNVLWYTNVINFIFTNVVSLLRKPNVSGQAKKQPETKWNN